jgi:hypothetical protein
VSDSPKCGARKKNSEGTCSHAAGERTEHPGEGRCYLHGGRTPRGIDSPHLKHGRDSKYMWKTLDKAELERVDELAKMPSVERLDRSIAMNLGLQEDAAARGEHRGAAALAAAVASGERAKIQREQAERLGGGTLRLPQLVILGITMTESELEERQEELTREELAAIDVPYTVVGDDKSAS